MTSHIFTSYIGEDTEVYVEFDYQPRERPVVSQYIEKSYPGAEETCTVTAVWVNPHDTDIDNLLDDLCGTTIDRLTSAAYEFIGTEKRCESE